MAKAKSLKPDDRAQSKAFIEKAREIGADKEGSRADDVLGKLAKKKPEPRTPVKGALKAKP